MSTAGGVIDRESIRVPGFQGELTEFIFELEDIRFDGQDATVELFHERNGDSAIFSAEDDLYELFIDNTKVDSENTSPNESGSGFTMSGPASPGDSVRVLFHTTQFTSRPEAPSEWRVELFGSVPQPTFNPQTVTVSNCSVSPRSIQEGGESVTFSIDVDNPNPLGASVEVLWEAGGFDISTNATVPAESTTTVSASQRIMAGVGELPVSGEVTISQA